MSYANGPASPYGASSAPSYSYGYGSPANNGGGGGAAAGAAPTYGSPPQPTTNDTGSSVRRRNPTGGGSYSNGHSMYGSSNGRSGSGSGDGSKTKVVERLDFMFPKVDKEFTVQTKGGGIATVVAYGLIAVLVLAETVAWFHQNSLETTKTVVDTSLGKRMRVNMNITFPSLACDDLHLDAIDVAGDSQIDIEDTLIKRRLHLDGRPFSKEEIEVEMNFHREQQEKKEQLLREKLPHDYCGPCYGAHDTEGQCCQTCDDVIMAYRVKRWKSDLLKYTAEQCVREGRDKSEPKKMTKGQGCNLSGYMTVNRVSGNFHIAMGEGIERDGRHIHTYVPEDAPNFNASHVIHQLSFGPEDGKEPLSGNTKIVTRMTGTTGLFQYFIKIVPTTYKGENAFPHLVKGADTLPSLYPEVEDSAEKHTVETNRYFFTERFMPLMTDLLEDEHYEQDGSKKAAVHAGYAGGHHKEEHHQKQNSVLPGVFFVYEIYPFALEITRNSVPFTHLLIRILATIGGVFTLARWADSVLYDSSTDAKRPSFSTR